MKSKIFTKIIASAMSVMMIFSMNMVLSPKGEDKYEMKYVPEDFDRYDQGFFGRAKPEYIIVKGECLEKLKQQGYEMDCWQKGIPLAINNKHPDSIKLKGF